MSDAAAPPPLDPAAVLRSRGFVALLVVSAIVGVVISFASWGFLEAVHWIQVGVYDDLPGTLGFESTPVWWSLPVLAIAGLITAFAIVRLPGNGGHVPAEGLNAGRTLPIDLPGVVLAALASIGLGAVIGPEAPLIALGGGLALFLAGLVRRDAPPQMLMVIAAAGSFAAVALIFDSPLIAAVILIEATGLGGPTVPLILLPGLLAAGVGSLVYIGMRSFSGLSTSAYALQPLSLPPFDRPSWSDFAWTIALGVAAALFTYVAVRIGKRTHGVVMWRPFFVLPIAGLAVAGLAIGFSEWTGHGTEEVLFSGQDALPGLVENPGAWSVGSLLLLLLFKGAGWGISLGSFRGGPTFPALFLGAAAGIAASHLPGLDLTPAVAVGMGAMTASMLRLPLSAIVLAVLLTYQGGLGTSPLIILGVVVAYLVTNLLSPKEPPGMPQAPAAPPAS
jgi:H+/Cl- antiporter ClcA